MISKKVDRIRSLKPRARPRTLDLFSGCGGLSLGFKLAGSEILGGVEIDPKAARTHAMNFHGSGSALEFHAQARDITSIRDPRALVEAFYRECRPEQAVDIIIGGPPCQAFARVGRAKLREIMSERKARAADASRRFYSVTTPVDAACRTTSDVGLGRAALRRSVFDLLTSLVTSLVLSHLSHVSNRIRKISSFS
jgi:hypothetical protein